MNLKNSKLKKYFRKLVFINNRVSQEKSKNWVRKIMNKYQVLSTYAAYSTNQSERIKSSSGGIFSLLANAILSKAGIMVS